jgi:hypothetical protein
MGELTIKLDDGKLLEALAEMASIHRQPIEAEINNLLKKAVEDHARRLELVRRADEIAARTPKGVVQTDSVELIREMREERDRELGC